jgi:hypothetical protein
MKEEEKTPLMKQWEEENELIEKFEKILQLWTEFATQNKIDRSMSWGITSGILHWFYDEREKIERRFKTHEDCCLI